MAATDIIVSYPSDDLARSKAFYTALGAEVSPRFTDENAVFLSWDENIFTMVLRRDFFATFTDKAVGNAATMAQFQIAFSRSSREEVDAVIEAGLAAGGSEHGEAQDHGFMYHRDLEDPDGNIVSFHYMSQGPAEMNPEASAAQPAQV